MASTGGTSADPSADPSPDRGATARGGAPAGAADERPRERGGRVDRIVFVLLSLMTRIFFRRIEVVGRSNVPAEGAVILVGNHPNSLIDPVLLGTTCGRWMSFAAKDTLFRRRLGGAVLRGLGGVPIRRRQDHPAREGALALDNRTAFSTLEAVLEQGGSFGIFPEGLSHSRTELQPLKSGTARIALEVAARGAAVRIVPCGLSYFRRNRMRSKVVVTYGPPLAVDPAPYRAAGADPDARKACIQTLTADLDRALRAVTINAPDFETLRTLEAIRRLLTGRDSVISLAWQAEATRRVVEQYDERRDRPEVAALYADVARYRFQLDAFGIDDEALATDLSRRGWAIRLAGHLGLMFVLAPLALPGIVVHAPIVFLAVLAGERLNAEDTVVATTKMGTAALLTLLAYVGIPALVFVSLPFPTGAGWASWTLLALVTSGWATIRVLERQSILRKSGRVLVALLGYKKELVALRATRETLREQVLGLLG